MNLVLTTTPGNQDRITLGLQILSGIIVKTTGHPLFEYANDYLFTPLGIEKSQNTIIQNKEEHLAFLKDKNVRGWVVDPKGVNTAGWGLALTTRDMMKIGQLYLNNGMWNKKVRVSSQWINESIKKHSQ